MTLYNQSQLAYDADFTLRITACISNEDDTVSPEGWASEHRWQIAAAPGFADKYSYAVETGVPNPGRNEAVISDAEVLAAVQAVLAGA